MIDEISALKERIHRNCLDRINLATFFKLSASEQEQELNRIIDEELSEHRLPMNSWERKRVFKDIYSEALGYGPLDPLLQDDQVSDILVNGCDHVYVERRGKLELSNVKFSDNDHLRKIIDKIVSQVGRRIDESSPLVDARLPDGSRVNAVIPPLALDGPALSIRKFSRDKLQLSHLITNKSLTPEIGEVLQAAVRSRMNILISGGTGSGKTTLLNMLSGFIPSDERIITIEDAAELQLRQEHVVRLETRPANLEGRGEITQRELVKNTLRMRPDRIVIGEVRGAETLDMLQAMNTGHDGSLTTVHANNPREALMRIETLVAMSGFEIPTKAMRSYISSAIGLILQQNRLSDGTRKLVSVQEVTGMEGDVITLQELFKFEQVGIDVKRRVKGQFRCMGVRPQFAEKAKAQGISLPPALFDPNKIHEC